MKFPNAANGVKKIFTAEILSLISSVCVFVTIVLMLLVGSMVPASLVR